ncbi:ATPase, P-type (transporting), HAD superfamily, subfamily IC/heavy metal translocating P-type ATPase [Desulfonatronum thiosulfatophilum]|uniref:P-type Zn(2+) transporter n=1 Tax=Desulfonatronum thiosulfatophilum TaxID=617002 RepID=A0A1G6EW57_9BACT|nr:ATPase, P-type (transporting), HAD superfamily, subfamily IC/heavy metal translocating P-type ATPase [Desulfonatronum thiosulfatophilum]
MRSQNQFCVNLVHALPGRFRLRLEQVTDDATWHTVQQGLADHHGVHEVRISPRTGSILIFHEPDVHREEILAFFNDQNLGRIPALHENVNPSSQLGSLNAPNVAPSPAEQPSFARSLSIPGMFLRSLLPPWIRLLIAARTAWPFLRKGLGALFRGRLNLDVLDGLAIGISLARRDLRSVMIITTLLSLGEYLEQWTRKRSREQLAQDLLHLPPTVWIKRGDELEEIPLEQVQAGDLVVVQSGGRIAVDGVVVEGEAMVNQASLTGEPLAVAKATGITVFAGTVVEEGVIVIRAEQVGDATRVNKIVKILEESERHKAGLQAKAEFWADRVVPLTLGLSLATFLLTRNVNRAVSVLLVDFSCAIKLSTPLTMLAAMREASTKGVLIKGGRYLEKLEQANTYVFDKTGTLTEAQPQGLEVVAFNGHDSREVLRSAACLEEHFPHPLARAVVTMAERGGLSHREEHYETEYILAHGIASKLRGQRILVGSRHFLQKHGQIDLSPAAETMRKAASNGNSVLYVAIGDDLAGIVLLEDPVRQEALPFLQLLRQEGVERVMMLTGDGEESAANVAQKLQIDEFHAQLLPEDKVRIVKQLRQSGLVVAMVGDGINDTPALSEADVGISMKSGADIAHEVCDVLLTRADLEGILTAKSISVRAMSRLRWNYGAAIGINAALVFLGLAGRISPSSSALLHNLVTISVTMNSLRPFDTINSAQRLLNRFRKPPGLSNGMGVDVEHEVMADA